MNRTTVLIGAALALLLSGLAAWLAVDRQPAREQAEPGLLLPTLAAQVNDITQLRLVGAGAKTLATLQRGDAGWTLAERDGYPADATRVRELLLKLSQLRGVEAKTANPALHARLGVEDVAQDDATSLRVELQAGDGEPLALVLGDADSQGKAVYARREGEAQSWLSDGLVDPPREAARWLSRELTRIDVPRVSAVTVTHGDGDVVRIRRAADGDDEFVLDNLPRGRESLGGMATSATAAFLADLTLEDVQKADAVTVPEAAQRSAARFALSDGVVMTLDLWRDGTRSLARLQAELDAAAVDAALADEQARDRALYAALLAEYEAKQAQADAPVDAAAETDTTEVAPQKPTAPQSVAEPEAHAERRRAALAEEVAALNARFEGWVFVLPSFKATNLHKRLEDYLKPKA